MADDVTPAQTASFDQAHAVHVEYLDRLIQAYRSQVDDGEHSGVAMAGLSGWVRLNLTPPEVTDLLAVAVGRLAEQGEDGAR